MPSTEVESVPLISSDGSTAEPIRSVIPEWLIRTDSDRKAIEMGCYYDEAAALRVAHFFRTFLRHTKGKEAGKPFELLPWQWERVIAPAFGWKLPDGTRRFRYVGIWIPKKNGKSTLAAAITLYMLCADNEPSAEVYGAASDRGQASIVYNDVAAMVRMNPALEKYLKVRDTKKRVALPSSNSFYQVISADANRNEGYNIHALIFDEVHTQRNRSLWGALKYGTAGRTQGMKIILSTAGELDETALWWELFHTDKKIQNSELIDVHSLAVVYAMEDTDDWHSEDTWRKVNPSYDYTINKVDFRKDYEEAKRSAANQSEFFRYHLNRATRAKTSWLSWDSWTKCSISENEDYTNWIPQKWFCGVDIADNIDIESAVFGGECKHPTKGDCVFIMPFFWCPESAATEYNASNRDKYLRWASQGFLRMYPGEVNDQSKIEDDILATADSLGVVEEIGIDKWNGIQFVKSMTDKLKKRKKKTKLRVVGFNAMNMNEATRLAEKLIISGRLLYSVNPVLDWMFGNVKIVLDSSGNKKIDKSGGIHGKVDAFSALTIMLYVMISNEPGFTSRYEIAANATKLQPSGVR